LGAALERVKVRKAMETQLQKTALKIVTTVNKEKDHIPPITTSESNPFPYRVVADPKDEGWGTRIGIF
jgi:autophagy-related protein 101